jgi:hypothetical protein
MVSQGQFTGTLKLASVTLAPKTVAIVFVGTKIIPTRDGVRLYEPFVSPAKLKFPEASATAVALDVPVNITVAPTPPAMLPLME